MRIKKSHLIKRVSPVVKSPVVKKKKKKPAFLEKKKKQGSNGIGENLNEQV